MEREIVLSSYSVKNQGDNKPKISQQISPDL